MSLTLVGRVSDPGKIAFMKSVKKMDGIAVHLIAFLIVNGIAGGVKWSIIWRVPLLSLNSTFKNALESKHEAI